jgi:hypothetical protein
MENIILRKFLAFLVFVLLLVGCGPSSTAEPASGVEGHVTIGPVCPVVQVDNPCPDKPFQATLTVLNPRGKKVTSFQTDTDGFYHVPLKPGDYVMHPESPNVMPSATDQPFTVLAEQFTTLDIAYDSGIR